jgi:hypothetical protein
MKKWTQKKLVAALVQLEESGVLFWQRDKQRIMLWIKVVGLPEGAAWGNAHELERYFNQFVRTSTQPDRQSGRLVLELQTNFFKKAA